MFGTTKVTMTKAEAIETANNYRKADKKILEIQSEIKNKQAAIAAKYEEELGDLSTIANESKAKLEAYVNENKEEILGDKKSASFAGITVGFRKTTAKLKLAGKKTWEVVLSKIKADSDLKDSYLVVKEEVNKNALKKAEVSVLRKLGLQIEQEDNFFVKL